MRKITTTPACPADLKYTNRIQVLNVFLDGSSYTASEVAAAIGLSRQTVMKSIQFFLRNGLLVSDGKGDSTLLGGKRPELFTLSKNKYFLCITLWPQEVRLNLTTLGGQVLDKIELSQPLPQDPKAAIDEVGKLSLELMEKHSIPSADLCAVSLSTSGIMDYKAGILKYSSQSPAWGSNVPLRAYLQEYFPEGTQIFLENAGKMTARPFLLEQDLTSKRVLVIFTCWGLSSCLIEKGRILSGSNALIGEIGHMIVDPADPERCGCGSQGCLERLVCVERIRDMAAKEASRFPDSALAEISPECLTLRDIFDASARCDPLGRYLVAYVAKTFATALRNISLIFDPDLIVFQGDYAYADPYFDSQFRRQLQEFQYFPGNGPFDIRYDRRPLSQMDAQGSFIALLQHYFDSPELYMESNSAE